MEVMQFDGEGYMPMVAHNGWCVALVNFAERLREENLCKIERHLETDEVFILLQGKVTLFTGENMEKHIMAKGKIYVVKRGEWHCIAMTEDAKVAIMENSGTGPENSEYRYF